MEKLTYSKALDVAIAAVAEGEVRDKLVALKASLEKKNSAERKPTATQTANEGFKEPILAGITEDGKYTITDLIKAVPEISELSNQRVSAIVRQMVETGSLVREEIKRIEAEQKAKQDARAGIFGSMDFSPDGEPG